MIALTNHFRRWLTLGVGALFVALGIWLMFEPDAVERLYPLSLNEPMARSEIRAVFGGFMGGAGVALLMLDLWYKKQQEAAMVLATMMGGLSLSRVVGFIYEGFPSGTVLEETIFEIGLFTVLIVLGAYRREN